MMPGIDPAVCCVSMNLAYSVGVLARETLLAVVGDELPDEVLSPRRHLLNKKPTIGWDSRISKVGERVARTPNSMFIKKGRIVGRTFACVFDSTRSSKREHNPFGKIVVFQNVADDFMEEEDRHLTYNILDSPSAAYAGIQLLGCHACGGDNELVSREK
jgi:hypothetical protein